jgi:hypothetical protein
MPWSEKQNRLFRAAQHDPEIAREHGLSRREAGKLADEGVKKDSGGDTAVENEEPATRRAKHASGGRAVASASLTEPVIGAQPRSMEGEGGGGFVDLSPVFNRTGSR